MASSSRGGRRKNTSTRSKRNSKNLASDGCCSSSKPSLPDHSTEEEEEEQQQQQQKKKYNAVNSPDKTPADSSGFSTPKAERSRVPDELSCPPAPKKRRLAGPRRPESPPSPVSLTSPDVDLFFLGSPSAYARRWIGEDLNDDGRQFIGLGMRRISRILMPLKEDLQSSNQARQNEHFCCDAGVAFCFGWGRG